MSFLDYSTNYYVCLFLTKLNSLFKLILNIRKKLPLIFDNNNNQVREEFNIFLNNFCKKKPSKPVFDSGSILVDGMWDNIGHWTRYCLIRKSLGFQSLNEIGLVGTWNKKKVKKTFKSLKIENFYEFNPDRINSQVRKKAYHIIKQFSSPDDIIHYPWPENVPGSLIYDHLLMKQRKSIVNIKHYKFIDQVSYIINSFYEAKKLLSKKNIKFLFLSHLFPAQYLALISTAISMKIHVVVAHSTLGSLRLIRMNSMNDYLYYSNTPSKEYWNFSLEHKHQQFKNVGMSYLHKRLKGMGEDLGSQLAFSSNKKINKNQIIKLYNWDKTKPIIGVYSSQWFDTPHAHGMKNFRDFDDWIRLTIKILKNNVDANFLIKPHPVEKWYGGLKLKNIFPDTIAKNIRIAEDNLNSYNFGKIIDAAITPHGTIGIELTYQGKPVLCADRSFYSDYEFTINSNTREDYIKKLQTKWWSNFEAKKFQTRCCVFAGWMYGIPDWQKNFLLPDDSNKDDNCQQIKLILQNNSITIEKELQLIRHWFKSEEKVYHPYKLKKSKKIIDIISARIQ